MKERLRWWVRAVRSRGADLKRAREHRQHFDKIAEAEHKKWKAAKKEGRSQNAARAKRRAQRATRKSAFWDEQVDDLRDGFKKAVARRERVKDKIRHQREAKANATGHTRPERGWNTLGRPVCAWMVPILDEARERGWRGYLTSGVRTPEESVGLCRQICPGGASSCSGLCAGVNSNHNATTCDRPQGAVDATDYYTLASVLRSMGNPIFNDLPSDRVHFSASGH